jgi:hypothetical protein
VRIVQEDIIWYGKAENLLNGAWYGNNNERKQYGTY